MIIALEGIDASGKNTQTKRLLENVQHGQLFSFPRYNTPVGQAILAELKKPEIDPLHLQALMLTDKFSAAIEIYEANKAGRTVILDRYWMSAVVYGAADGLDARWLEDIHGLLPQPDYWFLLDIPVEASVARRPDRRDHYEKNLPKLRAVRESYLFQFSIHKTILPHRWHTFDGTKPVDVLTHGILTTIRP